MKRCAVVGAGIAGLSAALYLSRDPGFQVEVFEKNGSPGGKAGVLSVGDFHFDSGPTIVTLPFVLEDLFSSLGEDPAARLQFIKLEIPCRYYYPDGTVFKAYADPERLCGEIGEVFRDDPESMRRYLAYSRNIYDLTSELFLFGSFHEWRRIRRAAPQGLWSSFKKIDPFRTMHDANRSFFRDKRIVQFLDRYATYNGSDPYRAPATLNVIPHVEQLGVYVPRGGIRAIPRAMHEAARKRNIVFHLGTRVDRIRIEGNRVRGILTGGTFRAYDVVVSNADVRTTYLDLLGERFSLGSLKYRHLEPSSSAVIFYWGIANRTPLEMHNILFSSDYRREFREIFFRRLCPEDPTVYIHISQRYCPGDCPEGMENWYVMVNAPWDSGQDWRREAGRLRARILEKIKKTLQLDLGGLIVAEKFHTPPDIARQTSSALGSLYGISSNRRISAFLRQGNRSGRIRGLYFCGGSAHPGGGVPLCVLSGKITAELVREHERC
ncbi:MAG: phytoene desaturase [Candidatus Aminicenantes bacterium]|nr:phytoene desaturase [Candidatus Aminicenantes bacterium]